MRASAPLLVTATRAHVHCYHVRLRSIAIDGLANDLVTHLPVSVSATWIRLSCSFLTIVRISLVCSQDVRGRAQLLPVLSASCVHLWPICSSVMLLLLDACILYCRVKSPWRPRMRIGDRSDLRCLVEAIYCISVFSKPRS